MKESDTEGVATHGGPESCVHTREGGGEALTGGWTGRVLSRENTQSGVPTWLSVTELRARELTQAAAAKLLGIDQPRVSALFHGRLRQFSLERLIRFLTALRRDVRIVIEEKPGRRRGKVIVEAA
jgi:predicted XRE-type DNA-binding protein